MLLFGSASRVTLETTVGQFVAGSLRLKHGIGGVPPDKAALDALIDEIWNADANKYLRAASPENERGHSPDGDTTTATLRLFPDEWIYLPVVEVQSPGWKLRKVQVSTADTATACTYIAQYATEQGLILPSTSNGAVDAAPSISPETLESYLYNSLLRTGQSAEVAYFYAASPAAAHIDAPPSTAAGGISQVSGQATPSWLLPFWHVIDRIRHAAAAHAAAARELHELTVDGRIVVAAIGLFDHVLAIYERERQPGPPPTGFFGRRMQDIADARSPDHGIPLDIHALRAALPDLRAKARQELVDSPSWAAIAHFNATLTNLAAIESEAAFGDLYAQFDADRAMYPATEQALQIAIADYVNARVVAPDSDAPAGDLLKAFWDLKAGDSPILQEIVAVFSGRAQSHSPAVDETSAIASLTALSVGNTPGPSSLWVSLSRLSLVVSIGTFDPTSGQTGTVYRKAYRDYMARLAQTAGITESVLQELESKAEIGSNRLPGKVAKAFAAAAAGAEKIAEEKHAGVAWTSGMSVINLWGILAGLSKYKQDRNAGKPWQAISLDFASVGQAGSGLAADVAQILATPEARSATETAAKMLGIGFESVKTGLFFSGVARHFGYLNGIFAGAVGILTIAKGLKDGSTLEAASGFGSVLMSAGYWADVWVTSRAKSFVVQEAALTVAGIVIDADILLAAGSVLNVAGILIVVGILAYTNRSAILATLEAASTPGPQKWVNSVLKQLAATKVVVSGSADLKTALANVQAAARTSTFVTWVISDRVANELRGWGASDDDLSVLGEMLKLGGAEAIGP